MAEQATQYKCDVCGATFRDADALTKHRAVHEATRPEKQDLEQGTQPPTQNPSVTNPGPSPGPALASKSG
jgi:hypothetical protein